MEKHVTCSRCHDKFVPKFRSRYGQICPWCENDLIASERELSHRCGLQPMSDLDELEFNKYWCDKKFANS